MSASRGRRALIALATIFGALVLSAGAAGAQDSNPYTGALELTVERPSMRTCDNNSVTAEGFLPNSQVTFTLLPDTDLGTVTTDGQGSASVPFELANATVGTTYTVRVVGTDQGGSPATLESDVVIVEGTCDGAVGPGDDNNGGAGNDNLSRTGTDLSGALRIGLVLLAVGAALLLATRKRQANTAS